MVECTGHIDAMGSVLDYVHNNGCGVAVPVQCQGYREQGSPNELTEER